MIENLNSIILIIVSILNLFAISILIIKRKTNIAIGLATIQAIAWIFRFLGYI